MVDRVRAWMADEHRGALWLLHDGEDRLVVDERPSTGRRGLRLHGWQATAYDACDRVRTLTGLARVPALAAVGTERLGAFLSACVSQRIMVRDHDRYLALAVATPARAWQPAAQRAPLEALA